ncbi:TetR/AcrR family transcriptional regulator [Streptomyces hainanensis]|uniref:TetR/AcrR family transcriptional regulator n=1 Tax=Streptomyces hainanensis TaxID=402648 RepID=A0A4R4TLJ7_9ACTN|nr:TetR family transcriptional regulator C-terminal domain-containing protein [Streptomyces hainanensis]TDC78861.1 TetR/AcrR family transcriptional regulator [Streptomyces hainanensis]
MSTPRIDVIADAALGLLAERGSRGLTHRAVDEAAGLPPGSTSNRARTRSALLELAVRRLAVREAAHAGPAGPGPAVAPVAPVAPVALDVLVEPLARAVHASITTGRELTRARFELALEATRRPELRVAYDAAGRGFRAPLVAALSALGAADPDRQARSLAAWCEGVQFRFVAGAESADPPTEAELRADLAELLRGMLGSERR